MQHHRENRTLDGTAMAENRGTGPHPVQGGGPTPARRRRVVDELCEAFAQDRIGLTQLEERLDRAARARSDADLASLLAGLPVAPDAVGGGDTAGRLTVSEPELFPQPRSSYGVVDSSRVPDRQFTVAFCSGRSRRGRWIPARRITVIACMGGVDLDFREAMFGSAVTELHVLAVMGGVGILVPPGVHVETSGFAVMGGFADDAEPIAPPDEGSPVLRISGFALMGGVDVRVRLPGETDHQARQRKRGERRARSR